MGVLFAPLLCSILNFIVMRLLHKSTHSSGLTVEYNRVFSVTSGNVG